MRFVLRAAIAALAVASFSACAKYVPFDPSKAPEQPCDPENTLIRSYQAQNALKKERQKEPRMTEMRVFLGVSSEVAAPRVLEAMLRCQMPVSQSTGGVIEANYGQSTGMASQNQNIARVYIVPLGDTATLVRFAGSETKKYNTSTDTYPISNQNYGNSGYAWMMLRNVAKQLLIDPSMKANRAQSTQLRTLFMPGDTLTKFYNVGEPPRKP